MIYEQVWYLDEKGYLGFDVYTNLWKLALEGAWKLENDISQTADFWSLVFLSSSSMIDTRFGLHK